MTRTRRFIVTYMLDGASFGNTEVTCERAWPWRPSFSLEEWTKQHPDRVIVALTEVT